MQILHCLQCNTFHSPDTDLTDDVQICPDCDMTPLTGPLAEPEICCDKCGCAYVVTRGVVPKCPRCKSCEASRRYSEITEETATEQELFYYGRCNFCEKQPAFYADGRCFQCRVDIPQTPEERFLELHDQVGFLDDKGKSLLKRFRTVRDTIRLLTETDGSSLTKFEQIYVRATITCLEGSDFSCFPMNDISDGSLAELYLRCGCFSEAERIFTYKKHWRKLGDLALARNDHDSARSFYSKLENEYLHNQLLNYPTNAEDRRREVETYRSEQDVDRLMRLAFHQSEWESVITLFLESTLDLGVGSRVTPSVFLRMLAIAIGKTSHSKMDELTKAMMNRSDLKKRDWCDLVESMSCLTPDQVFSYQQAAVTRIMSRVESEARTLSQAVKQGETRRARETVTTILGYSDLLLKVTVGIQSFLDSGDRDELVNSMAALDALSCEDVAAVFVDNLFIEIESIDSSVRFRSCKAMLDVYRSHPIIFRFRSVDCINLIISERLQFAPCEIIAGLKMSLASLQTASESLGSNPRYQDEVLDDYRLRAYGEWAELQAEKWLNAVGEDAMTTVMEIWAAGKFSPVQFQSETSKPRYPIEMNEWRDALHDFHIWMTERWREEMQNEQWKSEKLLFDLVVRRFSRYKVERHSRPIWLAPQHLDIMIPELSLAIEYQGEQHYRPVDIFGGEKGFLTTVERDSRKAAACEAVGVQLFCVRYDADMNEVLDGIATEYGL